MTLRAGFGWSGWEPAGVSLRRGLALRPLVRRQATRYYRPRAVTDQGTSGADVLHAWWAWIEASGVPVPLCLVNGAVVDSLPAFIEAVAAWVPRGGRSSLLVVGRALQDRQIVQACYTTKRVDDVRLALYRVGPVLVGTSWLRDMDRPLPNGYVSVSGPLVGKHAYLIVGYDPVRDAFRCVNSWGAGYGQAGRFWVEAVPLRGLLRIGGQAVVPVARRGKPVSDGADGDGVSRRRSGVASRG